MTLNLSEKFVSPFVSDKELEAIKPEVEAADKALRSGTGAGAEMLGWLSLPEKYDRTEYDRIKKAAEKIRKSCDIFVVIGIGGSYLGSRAVIEFLRSPRHNRLVKDAPEIFFSGCNISSSDLSELLELCEGRDVCINVISKSGTTTEPAVAFRIFRSLLEKKYGKKEAAERIFVTTDRARGTLKAFADREGYETFVVPDDVGGRYSVLSAVGLLPIAVSGIDLDELMGGAADAMRELTSTDLEKNPAYKYAALRNILYRKGKKLEILVGYEPYMLMFNEWWKQLFGESEGKEGQGVFPASVEFTADLHSMGQYIQEGSRNLFETVVRFTVPQSSCLLDPTPGDGSGLDYLRGRDLRFVNEQARRGTALAHTAGGVPNLLLTVGERTPYWAGQLVYFFEYACGLSGYLSGVNPFDQPGVEAYKHNMFALLGKPGYEAQRKAFLDQMEE